MKFFNKKLLLLLLTVGYMFTSIKCYMNPRSTIEAAIETGGTYTDSGKTIIQNGKIIDYNYLYENGITDSDIAQWQASANSNTSDNLNNGNNETTSTKEQNAAQMNDTTEQQTSNKGDEKVSYTEEEIEAAWTEIERIKPTCIETGYVTYSNTLTGETKTEELPLADHKYAEKERKEATCTEAGSVTYTCEICGDTYSEEIPALGHEYEWVTTKEASFFTLGEEQYVCKNCGDVSKTREISATCPIPLIGIIIGICVVLIGAVSGIVVLKKKRTIKEI